MCDLTDPIHTNTIEGYFSIFKRGMKGVYQHCGEKHLQRYLTEFDFRYNARHITDSERRDKALEGIEGTVPTPLMFMWGRGFSNVVSRLV